MANGAEVLNWIDALPNDVRQKVVSRMTPLRVKEGASLYERSNPSKGSYSIISGSVRLFTLAPDGRELIYKVCDPGESFGDLAAIDGEPYAVSAEALTDCELRFLPRKQLLELRKQHPALETTLLNFAAKLARASIMSIEVATIYPLPARIASRLAFLAASARARGEGVTALKIAQKDLGVMVGASRQAVNKVLAEFQSKGLVQTHYGSLTILDINGLRRQAMRFSSSVDETPH